MKRKIAISPKETLLLAVSIIVCLLLMEGVLRVRDFLNRNVRYAHNLEFETMDVLNADEFRGVRVSPELTTGHGNIFVIGDSFMYGVGVSQEQSIPVTLENSLSKEKCPVSVFNLGIPGAGPTNYAKTAAEYRQYTPDVVIVGLYLGNDIQAKESPAPPKPMSIVKKIRALIGNSAIVKSVSALLRSIRAGLFHECVIANETGVDILSYHLPKTLEAAMCDGRMNPHMLSRGALGDNDAYFQELTRRFTEDPTTKDSLLAVRNAFPTSKFLLLVIPSKFQVNKAYLQPMKELGYVFADENVVRRTLQDAVIAWARREGIETIDLLPLMFTKERQDGIRLFYQYDEHPNQQGAEFIAGILSRTIQKKDICQ